MRAQGILEVKNLWEAINPGFDENALKVEEHKKKDHSAKYVLYLLVNNDSLDDIKDCKAEKDIWETLKRIHTKFDTWHGLLLLKDYINTTKASDETINQYLNRRNRYCEIAFLKGKDEVFKKFQEYKKKVENMQERNMCCLRSDDGGEYSSKEFVEYLKKQVFPMLNGRENILKDECSGGKDESNYIEMKMNILKFNVIDDPSLVPKNSSNLGENVYVEDEEVARRPVNDLSQSTEDDDNLRLDKDRNLEEVIEKSTKSGRILKKPN
ncbi:hypothetical protein JTB14_020448 [Gonioctena quinquepunctata]|nr:hypothetical protein JTB14_020448 [Gonioctena quinquepunctata]